jgi:NAD-dependent SIR2 family protein deacetylase
MGNFATGKHAIAICDRCGQQYKFLRLKQEWNGLYVCPECYEPKHPQLDPPHHKADAQALPWSRPARQEPMTVFVGAPGDSAFESDGMQPAPQSSELIIGSSIGTVTVVIS